MDTSEGRVAAVTFSTPDEADKLIDLQEQTPLMFEGTELQLRFGSITRRKVPSRTLFVSLVGPHMEDTSGILRDLFSPYAPVLGVRQGTLSPATCFVQPLLTSC